MTSTKKIKVETKKQLVKREGKQVFRLLEAQCTSKSGSYDETLMRDAGNLRLPLQWETLEDDNLRADWLEWPLLGLKGKQFPLMTLDCTKGPEPGYGSDVDRSTPDPDIVNTTRTFLRLMASCLIGTRWDYCLVEFFTDATYRLWTADDDDDGKGSYRTVEFDAVEAVFRYGEALTRFFAHWDHEFPGEPDLYAEFMLGVCQPANLLECSTWVALNGRNENFKRIMGAAEHVRAARKAAADINVQELPTFDGGAGSLPRINAFGDYAMACAWLNFGDWRRKILFAYNGGNTNDDYHPLGELQDHVRHSFDVLNYYPAPFSLAAFLAKQTRDPTFYDAYTKSVDIAFAKGIARKETPKKEGPVTVQTALYTDKYDVGRILSQEAKKQAEQDKKPIKLPDELIKLITNMSLSGQCKICSHETPGTSKYCSETCKQTAKLRKRA